jgi:hypothetical protein
MMFFTQLPWPMPPARRARTAASIARTTSEHKSAALGRRTAVTLPDPAPLRPVACRCIKCKPYSVTEDQDSNITVSPAWMLKKDGTCVQCTGKGAELDCLACNPNMPTMCTKCEVSAISARDILKSKLHPAPEQSRG